MELKCKIWIEQEGELVFGRGRAELLEAVRQTGSISAAARKMGMSYRHAWAMLRASEQRLGRALVERARGGAGGGGARLTPQARTLLKKFRAVEKKFLRLTDREQDALQTLLD